MTPETDKDPAADILEPLKAIGDSTIAPQYGIASVALTLALKYHDIGTVQDGALYQQYKLEGKNMVPLHLDLVFDTAMRMEAHIMGASKRITALLIDALEIAIHEDGKVEDQTKEPTPEEPKQP